MKDAISYIRVSSEEQADSGLGLEAQRQRIAAYCTMKGLHLAEEFEDPGISAGKPLPGRNRGRRLPPRFLRRALGSRLPTPAPPRPSPAAPGGHGPGDSAALLHLLDVDRRVRVGRHSGNIPYECPGGHRR
jgi:hypothetical protein